MIRKFLTKTVNNQFMLSNTAKYTQNMFYNRRIYYQPSYKFNSSQSNLKPDKKTHQKDPKIEEIEKKVQEIEQTVEKKIEKIQKTNIIIEYAKEFIHLIIGGSKQSWKDFKYVRSITAKDSYFWNIVELREIRRIHKDQLKLVPFSLFVIIPLAELLLPVYLLLFPNAMPQPFMPEEVILKERVNFRKKQEEAHKELKQILKNTLSEFGYDPTNTSYEQLHDAFINNRELILQKLNFDNLDSESLKRACEFLMIEHFDGTNIINQLYKHTVNFPRYIINTLLFIIRSSYRVKWTHSFFNPHFKLNFFPFEPLKRILLEVQLKNNLSAIVRQNISLKNIGIDDKIAYHNLEDIARQRGIKAHEENEMKKRITGDYLNIIFDKLGNNENLIFWYSVIQFDQVS